MTQAILRSLGLNNSEISILFVDNCEIRKINNEYRNINKATDVLSFPQLDGKFKNLTPYLLGDIVISAEMACSLAQERKKDIYSEITFQLIHGVLHLIGYDHEESDEKWELMKAKESELMKIVGSS